MPRRRAISFAFTIHGQPGAQPRVRFRRCGSFVRAYDPKEAVSYKAEIKAALIEAMAGRPRLEGPVEVCITAIFERPKSKCSKREPRPQEWNAGGKDSDNVAKIVLDACNGIAFADDRQVARLLVEKFIAAQGEAPRVVVSMQAVPTEVRE